MKHTLPPLPQHIVDHINGVLDTVDHMLQENAMKYLPKVDGYDTLIIAKLYGFVFQYKKLHWKTMRTFFCKPENIGDNKRYHHIYGHCNKLITLTVEHNGVIPASELNSLMRPTTTKLDNYSIFTHCKSDSLVQNKRVIRVFFSESEWEKYQSGIIPDGYKKVGQKKVVKRKFIKRDNLNSERAQQLLAPYLETEAVKAYLAAYPNELKNLNIGNCKFIISRYKAFKTGNFDNIELTRHGDLIADKNCRKLGWNESKSKTTERPKYVSTMPLRYFNTAI